MTTQVPYGPAGTVAEPQPPTPTYPTAPPWAAAPPVAAPAPVPPPPAYGTVAPYGSPLPAHGQLLVAYPDEMHNASRVKAPAWWPVVPFTFFFVIPGIVSAARRSSAARRGHNGRTPYWITFGVTLVLSYFVWSAIAAVAGPVYRDVRETAVTKTVQEKLVKDGQLQKTARVTATSAQCDATGPRTAGGNRRYACLLKLNDGRTGTLDVTADSEGNWTAVPLEK
jgi:hypothetical protein